MENYHLHYRTNSGKKTLKLSIPGNFDLEIIGPREINEEVDITQKIRLDFTGEGQVLSIVNDAARPFIAARILKSVSSSIIDSPKIHFLVATGSHPPPHEWELKNIFGEEIYSRIKDRILIHDAVRSETVYVGKSTRGTEVEINRALLDYDQIVTVGSVEPHYFAGYTGGRKSLVPGISGFKTIKQNHGLAVKKESRILNLKDNPLHQDLMECTGMILDYLKTRRNPGVQAINGIMAGEKICHIEEGELMTSLDFLTDKVDDLFVRKIRDKKNLLISIADFPLNRDLYQSLKAFENGKNVLEEGGVLVLVAKCDQGVGPPHFEAMLKNYRGEEEFWADVNRDFFLSSHKIMNLLRFLAKGNRIHLVSALKRELVDNPLFHHYPSLQEAFDEALLYLAKKGVKHLKALIVNDGASVVPRV